MHLNFSNAIQLTKISIPGCVLEEAGLEPNCKLVCTAEQGRGEVRIVEADRRYDLTDLRSGLVDLLRERRVCLADLEEKLIQEEVIYGVGASEGTKLR